MPQKQTHLQNRLRAEKRFRFYGLAALAFSLGAVGLLLSVIVFEASGAMRRTVWQLEVPLPAAEDAVFTALAAQFPDVQTPQQQRDLRSLLSVHAEEALQDYIKSHPNDGRAILSVPATSDADMAVKSDYLRQRNPRLNQDQLDLLRRGEQTGVLAREWNWNFLSSPDSREPESAGIFASLIGSLWTMLVAALFALPLGVAAALYLEEFAPRNRLTRLIETNINNLAAVPSIVYGLLGLGVLLGFFGLPRSSPLVGGLTLGLLTLPVIVIATRSALDAVPPSVRDAALALGASRVQAAFHHLLPLALPGIMTGSIIGFARALGETAPLLMIGMVAFIAAAPGGLLQPASALPVQIFIWADSPERGFAEKTAAAIVILLLFLLAMNAAALYIRHKFEKKW